MEFVGNYRRKPLDPIHPLRRNPKLGSSDIKGFSSHLLTIPNPKLDRSKLYKDFLRFDHDLQSKNTIIRAYRRIFGIIPGFEIQNLTCYIY